MAISEHAVQAHLDTHKHFNYMSESMRINLQQVSISQLLGRDYLFIDTQGVNLPLGNKSLMYSLLGDLVQQLELAETHVVVISVDESPSGAISFIRHDLAWYKHQVCRIESTSITHPEQYEFMDMIWRCSTAVTSLQAS